MLIPAIPLPISVVGAKRMIRKIFTKPGWMVSDYNGVQVKFSDPGNSVAFSVRLSEQRCRQ